ncbi:oxidoreductase [Flavobacteriaceae bacterium F89]|uniref:Oxidoreductase n=1 Tax=Cerina litoralis TaxID=2874477 RepID=A0AAE3EVD8_9FLAO|nr:oxidoreductase [Cerina litoralis]MCG2460999.1 oxidoreductase [Cerina litoralis]
MKYTISVILTLLILSSCGKSEKKPQFSSVVVKTIYEDSLSIRAIEIMAGSLAFAANNGKFGAVDLKTDQVRTSEQKYDTILPEFRAVAHTATDFFMLSVGNPALLYKTGNQGKMELVYKEEGEGVFYDAMHFWNDREGIAVGDSRAVGSGGNCLSIIITRNGGNTWRKLDCSSLPRGIEGEGAFAASNTNIATIGDKTWIATTSSRIYFSGDKGKTWEVFTTPIVGDEPTEGIYSIDFYDELLGVAIGGDYTKPDNTRANKAITRDGGMTWQLIADGKEPSYKSCIQFVPDSKGQALVAVGFTGVSFSGDSGVHWKKLSKEPFFTFRFLNDSIAYAAGKGRISKLTFR